MDLRNLPLEPDKVYHICFKANNKDKLIIEEENYTFFLQKIEKYVLPIANIYAYVLLPNHFHFLLRFKDTENVLGFKNLTRLEPNTSEPDTNIIEYLSQQFANMLNSYAKSINKAYKRTGKLFKLPFKRIPVEDENYFKVLVAYIHRNPVHHKYCKNMNDCKYSSYKTFFIDKTTKIDKQEVLAIFGDLNAFIEFHKDSLHPDILEKYYLEDDE